MKTNDPRKMWKKSSGMIEINNEIISIFRFVSIPWMMSVNYLSEIMNVCILYSTTIEYMKIRMVILSLHCASTYRSRGLYFLFHWQNMPSEYIEFIPWRHLRGLAAEFLVLYIWLLNKMAASCRRHFKIHFLNNCVVLRIKLHGNLFPNVSWTNSHDRLRHKLGDFVRSVLLWKLYWKTYWKINILKWLLEMINSSTPSAT